LRTRTTVAAVSIRSSLLCWECRIGILTNSLTIFEEPLSASLWTLDSSVLDDLDFDFDLDEVGFGTDVDLDADADFDVDEDDFEVRVVLGSAMVGVVVVLNGWRGVFVVC
jgi:hypothetical protein